MRRFLVTAGVLATGLLASFGLSACAGGDDSPETPIVVTDTTEELSKDEFISQADAICAEVNTEIADIAAAGEGITRAADVADLRQGMLTDIRDLGTPSDTGSSFGSTDTDTESSTTDTDTGTDTGTGTTEDLSTFPEDEPSSTGTDSSSTDTGSSSGTETDAGGTGTGSDITAAPGDELEAFLQALEAQVKAGQKIDLASQRGESTVEPEAELEDAKSAAADAATSYGFEECGTSGTPSGDSTTSDSSSSSDSVAPSAPATPAPSEPSAPSDGGTADPGSTGGGVSPGGGAAAPE